MDKFETGWPSKGKSDVLCPYLYRDLPPPEHSDKGVEVIRMTVFRANRAQDYSRMRKGWLFSLFFNR